MALKDLSLNQTSGREASEDDLALLSEAELLSMRTKIDALLNLETLDQLDIGMEIVIQLRTLKVLQQEALDDKEAPHGQRAQASMTVSRLLQDLTKCRRDLYNAERSKKVEGMVIEAMKNAPVEAKEAFFSELERMLATMPSLSTLFEQAQNEHS